MSEDPLELDPEAMRRQARLPSVVARTDLEMLVLTDAQLHDLMVAVPAVDSRVRAAAALRLRRGRRAPASPRSSQ